MSTFGAQRDSCPPFGARHALAWVRKQVEQADTDLLREMVKPFCERVMFEKVASIWCRA
jgi:hypothetical protein